MRENLVQDLIIVWLITDNVVSDEAVSALEVDDLGYELIDLHLLDVDVDDEELEDSFSLDVLDKVLLAFEKLRRDVLRVRDLKVMWFHMNERLDEKTVE